MKATRQTHWSFAPSVVVACLVLFVGCTGTESGNPINPPGPPSVAEDDDTDDGMEQTDIDPVEDVDDPATGFESSDDADPFSEDPDDDTASPDLTDDTTDVPEDDEQPGDDGMLDMTDEDEVVDTAPDEELPDQSEPDMVDPDQTADDAAPDVTNEVSDAIDRGEAVDDAMGGSPTGVATAPEADGASPTAGAADADAADTAFETCVDSECQALAEQHASQLAQPLPSPAAYTQAVCIEEGEDSACECTSGVQTITVSTASDQGCVVAGRFGDCLYDSSEFGGCTMEGQQCQALCDDITARRQADAEAVEASVRLAACLPDDSCGYVLEAGTQCLLGPSLVVVDCALPDEELLGLPPQPESDAGSAAVDGG